MSVSMTLQPLSDETLSQPPPFPPQGLPLPSFGGIQTGLDVFDIDYIPDPDGDGNVPYVSLLTNRNKQDLQDLLEQQQFLQKILTPGNPIGFTPTGSCEIVTLHEREFGSETRGLCLFYKRHVSTDPHDCDECDDFCIKITDYLKLLIKYKTPRKTEFSKADFTQLHDFFVRIFNVMRLAFSGSRSIPELTDYITRVPNWFQKFQRNFVNASFKCEALEEDEEDKKAEALVEDEDEYERKSSAEALTMVRKEVEKLGKSMPSLANKHFALKKFQTVLRMQAIPRILLAIPEGSVNPYAQYIEQFFKSVNMYDMLYTCQAGIPQIGNEMTSASASSPASLDEEGGSFMTMFANEDENNIFCLATRRCSMTEEKVKVGDDEIPLDKIASDSSPQSIKIAMKAVLDMFFEESIIDMHVTRLDELTRYENMVTGESVTLAKETFKKLFDVYIDLKTSPTPNFAVVDDECLIKLAYFAECIGDRKMVFQIINYFLSYRFEYMVRLWKIEMPKVEEDLKMPAYFLTAEQWHEKCKADFGIWKADFGDNYGWDENGRDA